MSFVADPDEVADRMEECAKLLRTVGTSNDPIKSKIDYDRLVKTIEWIALELDGVTYTERESVEGGSLKIIIKCDEAALVKSYM
jgi:hypothetical protein